MNPALTSQTMKTNSTQVNVAAAQVNVARTITKRVWKRMHALSRLQSKLEIPPCEEGEEPDEISQRSLSIHTRLAACRASIYKTVGPILQKKKEARQELYRGKDDFWKIPVAQAKVKKPILLTYREELAILENEIQEPEEVTATEQEEFTAAEKAEQAAARALLFKKA